MKVKLLSCVRLLETPQTAAHQAPPFMGFSRQLLEWGAIALSDPVKHVAQIQLFMGSQAGKVIE